MKRTLTAVFVATTLLILYVLLAAGTRTAVAARAPLVLAFYYDWFDEGIWKPTQVADMPVAPYASRNPQVIARQIQQARGAGIDAFVVSWWGAGNPTDVNFKTLLEQARAANFSAAVDFELTSPFYKSKADAVKSLKNLLATHVRHPAYLRADGKPVVFFWREQKYSVREWQAIRDEVDPNRASLWIAEGTDTSYLSVFDGHHLYSVGWSRNVAGDLQKYAARTRAAGASKIWVATAMPGNDDTRTRRAGSYKRDRLGGDFYRETWRGAMSTSPDWIIITSWNEWVEGTQIEPSVTYGDLYLNITREFAAQYKKGLPPPAAPPKNTATRAPTPKPTVTPTLIPGGVRASVTDILRVRADPGTDAAVLGRLREGAGVTLLARSEDAAWLQIAYPDLKRRGWISAEYTKIEGNASILPVVTVSRAGATPGPAQAVLVESALPPEPDESLEVYGPPEPAGLTSDSLEVYGPPDPPEPPYTGETMPADAAPPEPGFSLPWLFNILPFLH